MQTMKWRAAQPSESGTMRIAIDRWHRRAALCGKTAIPIPFSTIRATESKLLSRTRSFIRRPARAA
jgi:hypothetical protein